MLIGVWYREDFGMPMLETDETRNLDDTANARML
jgi:hypothetical protein